MMNTNRMLMTFNAILVLLIGSVTLNSCSLNSDGVNLEDNRKIVVEPKHIEVSGDIEPWDWEQVHLLHDKITKIKG